LHPSNFFRLPDAYIRNKDVRICCKNLVEFQKNPDGVLKLTKSLDDLILPYQGSSSLLEVVVVFEVPFGHVWIFSAMFESMLLDAMSKSPITKESFPLAFSADGFQP
jgi:hypothetical protein